MLFTPNSMFDYITRIVVAAILGALIGLERDMHGRSAGLRTHLLLSMGAAVFTIMSLTISAASTMKTPSDPGRIAAQIIAGIGFLGAGVIIKEGASIRGLTTAACVWVAAAIGMASGSGNYIIAVWTTAFALFCLLIFKYLEKFYYKDYYRILAITTSIQIEASQIIDVIKQMNITILRCDIDRNYDQGLAITTLAIRIFHRGITDKLAHGIIAALEESHITIKQIKWFHP